MVDLYVLVEQQKTMPYPDLHLLGNFIDNHDNDRFLYNHSGDATQLRNALTWTMLYHGLPIVYYGTEQVEVSNLRFNRASMWPYYGITALYNFTAELNQLRRLYGLAVGGVDIDAHGEIVSLSINHLAFTRGRLLVLVTNAGT